MITCRNCRAVLLAGTLFCPECGIAVGTGPVRRPADLAAGELARPPEAVTGPDDEAWEVTLVIDTTGRRLHFRLGEPICVGRQDPQRGTCPEVDLSGDQGAEFGVSRLHATIRVVGGRVVVVDLESKNGTILNHQPLQAKLPYPLHSGDEVCFGQLPVHVYVESGDS